MQLRFVFHGGTLPVVLRNYYATQKLVWQYSYGFDLITSLLTFDNNYKLTLDAWEVVWYICF